MMQARYTTECTGHFGLALEHYCHFTSPIRRYPDLQIHRIIKDFIRGRLDEKKIAHYAEILPEIAKHCSETERRADDAERDTDKLKKAEFMEQHIGEVFEGTISGVTGWGMFVELDNTCEGMIRLTSLDDDYYVFNESSFTLTGADYGKEYRLGQRVTIKVVGADRIEKTIDFRLVGDGDDPDDIPLVPVHKPLYMQHMENSTDDVVISSVSPELPYETADGHRIIREDDNLMTGAELREHERKKRRIEGLEPDSKTGHPRVKDRKKYKVHKYKKAATSKAARDQHSKKHRK
jgi:ribonuclease R